MANAIDTLEPAQEDAPDAEIASFGFQSRDVLPIIASIAGLASGVSGQQPTGNIAADFALSFGFGWAVVWFSQFAPAKAVLGSALLAFFVSGLQMPAVLIAAAAAASAVFVTLVKQFDRDSSRIGLAVSAAFTSQAVLNLPNVGFTASASLLAAIAIAPILVLGFRRLAPGQRRAIVRAALVLAVLAIVATVLAVVAALGVKDHVETGITQAEGGVAALQNADRDAALSLLEASQENFEVAHNRLSGPLTWPARFVPITAQHSRALETASAQGLALARTAARTGNQADVEKIRGSNGEIDLSIVQAVNTELTVANATLQAAQQSLTDVSTPWLVPQLTTRLETAQEELADAGADIDLANHATAVLPGILGANGPRRYLVLFVQPAESREFGGFVGAYGVLDANQGRLSLAESGSIDVDLGFGTAAFTDITMFPEAYARIGPQINGQNLTAVADLGTIAAAARDFVPQWREDEDFTIDGVLTIDPYALGGLLELSGPIFVEGRDEPLDATNVVDFLLRDQYLEFERSERDLRQDTLRVLAGQAFDRLLSIEIPGPERLGSIFGPLARADRLAFTTFDDFENAFLDRVLLSANMPQVGSAVDMIGIYGQTGTASKLDGYATRSSTYEVVIDPATGEMSADLTIVERNDAPPDANGFVLGDTDQTGATGELIDFGSNVLAFGIYTRADVQSITVDTTSRLEDPVPAFSYVRHPVFFNVPLGGQATVEMAATWQVEPGRYDVLIPAQATANVSEFTLSIRPTPGWRVVGDGVAPDGSWTDTFALEEPRGLTFLFEATS